MQKQNAAYMDKYLSPFLCGYRKGYNAQHALLSLLEKRLISLGNKGYSGALLMDLFQFLVGTYCTGPSGLRIGAVFVQYIY